MENTKRSTSPVLQAAVVGIKLLLICAIIAALISFVYALTLPTRENNRIEKQKQAIGEIFPDTADLQYAVIAEGEETVYQVKSGDTPLGYCVEVASAGFGGDISLMVGYDDKGTILGVSIVSHSETPGLGEKVDDATYLGQYQNQSSQLELGSDIDAISGATISSKAVLAGVNRATEALNACLEKGGAGA